MKKGALLLLVYPLLLPVWATLHSSPVDYFIDNLRSLVTIPVTHIAHWDDAPIPSPRDELQITPWWQWTPKLQKLRDVLLNSVDVKAAQSFLTDPAFPRILQPQNGRVLKPTCTSLEGPLCAPLTTPLPTTLFRQKGIGSNTLYRQRMLQLLQLERPKGLWVYNSHGEPEVHKVTKKAWNRWLESNPSGEDISRILAASDFRGPQGRLTLPQIGTEPSIISEGLHRINPHNASSFTSEARRVYVATKGGHEAEFRLGKTQLDRGFLDNERRWILPGAAVDVGVGEAASEAISTSHDPKYMLMSHSYSLFDEENIQHLPNQFEYTMGHLKSSILDHFTLAVNWVRQAPVAAERSGGDLYSEMFVDWIAATELNISGSYKQKFKPYSAGGAKLSNALKRLVEDEVELLRMIPAGVPWDVYAAALHISPESVLKWRSKPREPARAVTGPTTTRSPAVNLGLSIGRALAAQLRFVRLVTRSLARGLRSLLKGLLSRSFSLTFRGEKLEEPEAPLPRPPGYRPPGIGKAADTLWSDAKLAEEHLELMQPIQSPILFSRYTGICQTWEISRHIPPWYDEMPLGFSIGLPRSLSANWVGSWLIEENVPKLTSTTGEVHFSKPIVLEGLWLHLEDLYKRPEDRKRVLTIRGVSVSPTVEDLEYAVALKEWRENKQGVRGPVETAWSIRVLPKVFPNDTAPINILEHFGVEGFGYRRISMLSFRWTQAMLSEEADSPPTFKWSFPTSLARNDLGPGTSSHKLGLHKLTFHHTSRVFGYDFDVIEKILAEEGNNDPAALLKITHKAKIDTHMYQTLESSFPSVMVTNHPVPPSKAAQKREELTNSSHIDSNGLLDLAKISESEIGRSGIKHRPVPFSLRARPDTDFVRKMIGGSGHLRQASPTSPRFAQVAPDWGLAGPLRGHVQSAGQKPALSRNGVVLGMDERPIATRLSVQAMDLSVEAPVITFQMAHKHRAMYSHAADDFWTDSEYLQELTGADLKSNATIEWIDRLRQSLESAPELKTLMEDFRDVLQKGTLGGPKEKDSTLKFDELMNRQLGDGTDTNGPSTQHFEDNPTSPPAGSTMVEEMMREDKDHSHASGSGLESRDDEQPEVDGAIRQIVESTITKYKQSVDLGGLMREVNVLAMVEDLETGEMITKTVTINLEKMMEDMDGVMTQLYPMIEEGPVDQVVESEDAVFLQIGSSSGPFIPKGDAVYFKTDPPDEDAQTSARHLRAVDEDESVDEDEGRNESQALEELVAVRPNVRDLFGEEVSSEELDEYVAEIEKYIEYIKSTEVERGDDGSLLLEMAVQDQNGELKYAAVPVPDSALENAESFIQWQLSEEVELWSEDGFNVTALLWDLMGEDDAGFTELRGALEEFLDQIED